MVTNPKIEKKKADIARTETRLLDVKARLREQKQDLVDLENEEIVAMFRKEVITEDDLKSLMRSRLDAEAEYDSPDEHRPYGGDDSQEEQKPARHRLKKEEQPDALSES
ncbi:MAG: DUF4315 family protein [Clostridiales bacterium]|jgi:hypothetical protein|nr:DUF4315 family protein [Clostridiales bacterium]